MSVLIPRPTYPPYGGGEDAGRKEADKLLTATEKKVHKVYKQAAQEMKKKADDYLAEFISEDRERAAQVVAGTLDMDDYLRWRRTHILQGRRWYEMVETLATDMTNSNLIAQRIINGTLPDVYAIGYNYGLYQGEIGGGFKTSFTLYNHDAVERLVREEPDLLPVSNLDTAKDVEWNRKKINSSMLQSIMQGERIEQIATRLAASVTSMNENVAIRNARTAYTSAENGGRYDCFRRLKKSGVDLVLEWCATLDSRTRHTHRLLDGQRREVDEAFEVDGQKILYAGDPYAPQGLIWNCRCTILSWVKGFEENREIKAAAFPDEEYDSYTAWKFDKQKEYEERKSKPRVNPDNPSYGFADDFKTTEYVDAGEAKPKKLLTFSSESDNINARYVFAQGFEGDSSVNTHVLEMPDNERRQWEYNLRRAKFNIDDTLDEYGNAKAWWDSDTGVITLPSWSQGYDIFHEVSHSIQEDCVEVSIHAESRRFSSVFGWRDRTPYDVSYTGVERAIDAVYEAIAEDGEGSTSWRRDRTALYTWLGVPSTDGIADVDGDTVLQAILDNVRAFKKQYGEDAGLILSDMIDGITAGEFPLFAIEGLAGHEPDYYRRSTTRRFSESWAEISALHALQDERAIEEIRKILPATVEATDTVWRVVYGTGEVFENVTGVENDREVSRRVLRISKRRF